jgi:hypothetical protein
MLANDVTLSVDLELVQGQGVPSETSLDTEGLAGRGPQA